MSVAGDGWTEPLLNEASPFWRAKFLWESAKQNMVDIAQLVSASDCGSEGRGFESHYPPHKKRTPSWVFFFLWNEWGFEEVGRAQRGNKVSGGHFISPGENPKVSGGS